jgi:hypothetical protein
MKQKDIAFQLGISEAYVTQLKKVIAFFLTRIRAILGPKTIKQPRKCPFYQHFRGSVRYSNSSHRSFIPIILIALSLFWVAIFAIFAGIFFTVIKIVLKTYSCIKPIIYSDIQKLSLVIAFVPEFFYQLLKSFHGHFTIHFVPIFLLKQQHFMY